MKYIFMLVPIVATTFTYASNVNQPIPQDFMGLDSTQSYSQQTQNVDQTILPSQSVAELSPSSSLKYASQAKFNMFGSQLFKGAFASTAGSTFNSSYRVNPGDSINLRMWGAYQYSGTQNVDPQGNIFIPNVGPINVLGVTNGSLQGFI